jgi:hypothetical protein
MWTERHTGKLGSDVLSAANWFIMVFLVTKPCGLVSAYQKIHLNVGNHVKDYMAS